MNTSRGKSSFKGHKPQPLGVGVGGFPTKLPKRRGGSGPSILQNFVVAFLFVLLFGLLSTADLLVRVVVLRREGPSDGRAAEDGRAGGQSVYADRGSVLDEPFPGMLADTVRLRELEVEEKGGRGGEGEGEGGKNKEETNAAVQMVWTEPRIRTTWEGPPLQQVLDQKIEAARQEIEKGAKGAKEAFQLHIQVDSGCEDEVLKECLRLLRGATYGGDRVHLIIAITCPRLPLFVKAGGSLCVTRPTSKERLSDPGTAQPDPVIVQNLPLLPRFDFCGRALLGGAIASNVEQLKAFLGPLARKGGVVGVMVSPGYDDMLTNWLCYIKELSLHNFFIITQERQQAIRLSSRGLSVYHATADLPPRAGAGAEKSREGLPLDYGSIEYKKFILARTKAIGEILHAGYNVLLADVDAVWFSDPFVHMKEEGVDMFAQLEERGNPCGGFLYLLHTKAVIHMWDSISTLFEEHIEWLETHPSKKDPLEYATFLESQKHSHEQKYLQDFLHGGKPNVRLKGLDPLLFINGRDYFDRKYAQHAGIVPVMIHNNYIVGKESKVKRFEIKGMWRLEENAVTCKCLTLSCADTSAPWASLNVTLPERERINFKRRYGQRTRSLPPPTPPPPPSTTTLQTGVASIVHGVVGGGRAGAKSKSRENLPLEHALGGGVATKGVTNGTGLGRGSVNRLEKEGGKGVGARNRTVVGAGGGKRGLLEILERIQERQRGRGGLSR